jgi:hypothetical protein
LYIDKAIPKKNQLLKEITDLLGIPEINVTVGSSIPSVFFTEVAAHMGIPIVSGMPAMAKKIIENSGLTWNQEFSSEDAPSGGGGTVTALGLLQLKNAVLIWLGHDPVEIPPHLKEWQPDPNWYIKREQLNRELSEKISRPGAPEFRNEVLSKYESRCAISAINSIEAIEVAHIVPYYGIESDHIQNAIPLRSDLHKLFDRGLIEIEFNSLTSLYEIKVHESILNDYGQYHGKNLITPSDSSFSPSSIALKEHKKMLDSI